MSDRISGINNATPYNGSGGYGNAYYKKKEDNTEFQQILDDNIDFKYRTPVKKGVRIDNFHNVNITYTEELSYPIKYFAIPVYYVDSNDNNMLGYIASKCFIVGDNTLYMPDNAIKHEYKIVAPYYSVALSFPEMNVPVFENNRCINSIDIDEAFENYKLAKDKACELNNSLNLSYSTIKLLDSYEELIFNRTSLLEVTKRDYQKRL